MYRDYFPKNKVRDMIFFFKYDWVVLFKVMPMFFNKNIYFNSAVLAHVLTFLPHLKS